VCAVCFQVEVSATSWSLVQRNPTDCSASLCVMKKLRERGGHILILFISIPLCYIDTLKVVRFRQTQLVYTDNCFLLTVYQNLGNIFRQYAIFSSRKEIPDINPRTQIITRKETNRKERIKRIRRQHRTTTTTG
jgi:hypothetical protein